jgi:hypothetical protein
MTNTIYNDKENWKPIIGYEGYEISSHGRARSVDRLGVDGRRLKGKMLSPGLGSDGYYTVTLYKDGKGKTFLVHRLVAGAFVEGYAPGLEVCHNDGDRSNNHYTNLRWDTRAGNCADRVKHGTHQRGECNVKSKLTPEQVLEIRPLYATGDYTQKQLAKMFGVHDTLIGKIVNRKIWKHI